MAVKQRFEDERYEEIGKEQVGELWLHLLLADTQSRAAAPWQAVWIKWELKIELQGLNWCLSACGKNSLG